MAEIRLKEKRNKVNIFDLPKGIYQRCEVCQYHNTQYCKSFDCAYGNYDKLIKLLKKYDKIIFKCDNCQDEFKISEFKHVIKLLEEANSYEKHGKWL